MNTERTPPQDLGQPGAQRAGVQDLDPALAERLHQLRKDLGLSVGDMAQRLGLWGANGGDNLRQMERCKRPLPGTLQVLLGYMERDKPQPYQLEFMRALESAQPPPAVRFKPDRR